MHRLWCCVSDRGPTERAAASVRTSSSRRQHYKNECHFCALAVSVGACQALPCGHTAVPQWVTARSSEHRLGASDSCMLHEGVVCTMDYYQVHSIAATTTRQGVKVFVAQVYVWPDCACHAPHRRVSTSCQHVAHNYIWASRLGWSRSPEGTAGGCATAAARCKQHMCTCHLQRKGAGQDNANVQPPFFMFPCSYPAPCYPT